MQVEKPVLREMIAIAQAKAAYFFRFLWSSKILKPLESSRVLFFFSANKKKIKTFLKFLDWNWKSDDFKQEDI